jgi:hypothetical protein
MTNLPKFLCIGVQKAATSWLWVQLRWHPEVWMPPVKELHYFDHLFVPENRSWTTAHIQKNVKDSLNWHAKNGKIDLPYFRYMIDLATENIFSEEWYRKAYSWKGADGKLAGDVTPEYFMIPEEGIEYVKKLLGPIKLILIIRDPVDRAESQIRMNLNRSGRQFENLSESEWMQEASRPDIFNKAKYSVYLPRWLREFGEESFLLLRYEEVSQQPLHLLQKVENFLGLSSGNYPDPKTAVHEGTKKELPTNVKNFLEEKLQAERTFIGKNLK